MNFYKIMFQRVILLIVTGFSFVQSNAQLTTAYSDPAQLYNRLTRDKFNNTYTLVGTFKVTGTPYLFGEKNEGVIYSKTDPVASGNVSFNTFNQQVEWYPAGAVEPIRKELATVDSFTLSISSDAYKGNIKFINAENWGSKSKFFLQVVAPTAVYTLYKRFYSDLEIVTTNYVQSELRQFELKYEYYYAVNGEGELKKLKTSPNGLKNEFPAKKQCWNDMDFTRLTTDKENFLTSFFEKLSACK